jgi:mannitol/fructose-specific phosphotransferase system IIA component (Ntr-type)
MELPDLVSAIRVAEITARTRAGAVRALVRSAGWVEEGIDAGSVAEAVEAREATAHTVIADGLALPHAIIDWNGDFRVVLGRSRAGVDCGIPGVGLVHLVVLFVVGRRQRSLHLEILAALAELLHAPEFRRALVEAPDAATITRLLRDQAGLAATVKPVRRRAAVPRLNGLLVRGAVELAGLLDAQALLVAIDEPRGIPWESLAGWTRRILVVSPRRAAETDGGREARAAGDTHWFDVPHAGLSRLDRTNLGILLAASARLLDEQAPIVCLTGPGGLELDSVTVARPDAELQAMFGASQGGGREDRRERRPAVIRPAVILRVLSLALELASEGREAHPVGALFVIGDVRQVLKRARQMVLNPFHGYARSLRSVLDPSLAETIKEFAQIDGAFIVDADGIVLSAGTYLAPGATPPRLPPGLGARHQAAAAITVATRAMAIALSQSTGTVTVFRHGAIVLRFGQTAPAAAGP